MRFSTVLLILLSLLISDPLLAGRRKEREKQKPRVECAETIGSSWKSRRAFLLGGLGLVGVGVAGYALWDQIFLDADTEIERFRIKTETELKNQRAERTHDALGNYLLDYGARTPLAATLKTSPLPGRVPYAVAHPEKRPSLFDDVAKNGWDKHPHSTPERDQKFVDTISKRLATRASDEFMIIFVGDAHAVDVFTALGKSDTSYIGTPISETTKTGSVEFREAIEALGGEDNSAAENKNSSLTTSARTLANLGKQSPLQMKDLIDLSLPENPGALILMDQHDLQDTGNIDELPNAQELKQKGFRKVTFIVEPLLADRTFANAAAARDHWIQRLDEGQDKNSFANTLKTQRDKVLQSKRFDAKTLEKLQAAIQKLEKDRIGLVSPRGSALLRKVESLEKEIQVEILGIE